MKKGWRLVWGVVVCGFLFMACENPPAEKKRDCGPFDAQKQSLALIQKVVCAKRNNCSYILMRRTENRFVNGNASERFKYLQAEMPAVKLDTVQNLVARNAQAHTLELTDFGPDSGLILMTAAEWNELSKESKSPMWSDLKVGARTVRGYCSVSEAGFGDSGCQALLHLSCMSGTMIGSGTYYLFERIDGKWVEVATGRSWRA